MRYAEGTSVPVSKSRAELEMTVNRYGASAFASAFAGNKAEIMFELKGWRVLFTLPLPAREEFATKKVRPGGGYQVVEKQLSPEETEKRWEQACRQRWRALALAVKAKLEAVECGITSFEEEFLAHIVLPGSRGGTAGTWLIPQLEAAYKTGKLPPLLGGGAP